MCAQCKQIRHDECILRCRICNETFCRTDCIEPRYEYKLGKDRSKTITVHHDKIVCDDCYDTIIHVPPVVVTDNTVIQYLIKKYCPSGTTVHSLKSELGDTTGDPPVLIACIECGGTCPNVGSEIELDMKTYVDWGNEPTAFSRLCCSCRFPNDRFDEIVEAAGKDEAEFDDEDLEDVCEDCTETLKDTLKVLHNEALNDLSSSDEEDDNAEENKKTIPTEESGATSDKKRSLDVEDESAEEPSAKRTCV